jgi:hypothetical protein
MLVLKPTREEKEQKQPIVNDRDATESVVEFGGLPVPKTIIPLWSTIGGMFLWMNVALQPLPSCLFPNTRVSEMLEKPVSLHPGIRKTQVPMQMRNEKGREKPIVKDRDGIESVVILMPRVIFRPWTTI